MKAGKRVKSFKQESKHAQIPSAEDAVRKKGRNVFDYSRKGEVLVKI